MTPLRNRKTFSVCSWLFNVGPIIAIKKASRFFCCRYFYRTWRRVPNLILWFRFSLKYFASSDSLRMSSWSFHRMSIFRMVSSITKTRSFIILARWVRVLIFQRKQTFNFLNDPLNSHFKLLIGELMELWQESFSYDLIL